MITKEKPAQTSIATETRPLPVSTILWYSVASLGYGTFYGFNSGDISIYMKSLTANMVLVGLMGSTHSIEGIVIQPIVGMLSDRCRHPMGRRRPFMIAFTILSALFMCLTTVAVFLPRTMILPFFVFGVFLFTVTFNIAYDPYQSLMPDITPEKQRGTVYSVMSLAGVIGQAAILMLDIPIHYKFSLVAAVMVVTVLLTCWRVREVPISEPPKEQRHPISEMREALKGLKVLHQAAKTILVSFFFGLGTGVILPFLTRFCTDVLRMDDHQAEQTLAIVLVTTAVLVLPFGWLTDHMSPRVVMMVSLALFGVAMLLGLKVNSIQEMRLLMVLAGVATAAQAAAIYPLLTQMVPEAEIGFYTGLQTMALSLAQPVTVVAAGIGIGKSDLGYRIIFAMAAASMFAGFVAAATIKRRKAPAEIARRVAATVGS